MRPEAQLDALLVRHTDIVLDDSHKTGILKVDIRLFNIGLHMATTNSTDEPLSALDMTVQGLNCTIQRIPDDVTSSAALDITGSALNASLAIRPSTVEKGDISFADISHARESKDIGNAVLRANVKCLQIGLLHSARHDHLRGKVETSDLDLVTPGVQLVLSMARIWGQAIDKAQNAMQSHSSSSRLLYAILQGAIAKEAISMQPPFAYESAYGLHVQDQRNIRRDTGWIMLSRLRHWHRLGVTSSSTTQRSSEDMLLFVVSQLAEHDESVGENYDLIRQQEFIKHAFSIGSGLDSSEEVRTNRSTPSIGLFVTFGTVTLRHFGRSVDTGVIAPSTVRISSASIGLQRSMVVRSQHPNLHLRLVTTVRSAHVEIQSGAFPSVQSLLKHMRDDVITHSESKSNVPAAKQVEVASVIVFDGHLDTASLSLLASGLRLRFAVSGNHTSVFHRMTRQEGNEELYGSDRRIVTLCSEIVELALLQHGDEYDVVKQSPDRLVVSTKAKGLRLINETSGSDASSASSSFRLLASLRRLEFDSRPQLRAFYLFARDWQDRFYPLVYRYLQNEAYHRFRHYQPFVDELQSMIASRSTEVSSRPSVPVTAKIDISIGTVQLQVRAAKAVWLRWDVGKIYLSRQSNGGDVRFGVKMNSQLVSANTSTRRSKMRDSSTIQLPPLTAMGKHFAVEGRPHLSATINLGFFVGLLKPAALDRLLSLHQRLGTDVLAFVDEFRDSIQGMLDARHSKARSTASDVSAPLPDSSSRGILFDVELRVSGVRFGLRADDVASTLLFEAFAMNGHATNQGTKDEALLWRARVEHFGLSLGHLVSADLPSEAEPLRNHRSAYMVLDVDVQEIPGTIGSTAQLNVCLNRVNTVMHVAALSELTDLVRSWQSDIHTLRDSRASEVAEFKVQTTCIIKKLDVSDSGALPEVSWFANRLFAVEVTGFGVAIPLDDVTSTDLRQFDALITPALLLSIRTISFQNKRNETARFRLQQMALQFLDK